MRKPKIIPIEDAKVDLGCTTFVNSAEKELFAFALAVHSLFGADIRTLFTEKDIHAMSKALNLGSYDDVKAHAALIYDRIRGIGGTIMPSPTERRRSLAAISD